MSILALIVAYSACFKAVCDAWLGAQPNAKASIRYGLRRSGKVFLLGLVWFAFMLGRLDPVRHSADLARRRLEPVDAGAAVRGRGPVQGAGAFLRADQGALVGDVRDRSGLLHPRLDRQHRGPAPAPDRGRAGRGRERGRQRDRPGGQLHAQLRDHDPVLHGGPDDPVLRSARAQGGLRPPVDRREHGHRARPERPAPAADDRPGRVHARAARRGTVLAAAAGLGPAAGAATRGPAERMVVARGLGGAVAPTRRCGAPTAARTTRRRPTTVPGPIRRARWRARDAPRIRRRPARSPPAADAPAEEEPPPTYPGWTTPPAEDDKKPKPDRDRADWQPPESPRGPGGL